MPLRLTPDEWMAPLFGLRWADFGGKRDVLEGRLIWVGHQVLRAGVPVILDFGCWSPEERYALRAIADLACADFELSIEDHERFRALFSPPTPGELRGCPFPPPPTPFESWLAWASGRWPTLPRLDT